jgi:hypothetical protein
MKEKIRNEKFNINHHKSLKAYFSEMAVSDNHGGGLTLQQVLGADLLLLDSLISVGSFARTNGPAKDLAWISQQIDLPLDALPERTKVLRRLKPWLRSRTCIHRWEVNSAWNSLKRIIRVRPRLLVCPQWSLSVELIARAVKESGAEYITWVMDDHPLRTSGAEMSYETEYENQWREHLGKAYKVFVISEPMGDFYRSRFGVDFEVLHGAVPLAECEQNHSVERKVRESGLRCAYAGSLSGWTRDGLELVADALQRAGGELHVAAQSQPNWLKRSVVKFHGFMDQKSAKSMMSKCDAIVLPVSFKPEHTAMSRLNIATKLSELCASGRPILAIGPADAAMIHGLQKRKAAVCITEPSAHAVSEGVIKLCDYRTAGEVVANAKEWFKEQLNLESMRAKWSKVSPWLLS